MKKTFRVFGMLLCAIFMAVNFTSCSDDDDEGSIVGTWMLMIQEEDGQWFCQYNFKSDGSLQVKDWSSEDVEPSSYEATGKWSVAGDILTITVDEGEEGENWTEAYRFKLDGNKLIIYDYEEDGPNVFVRK
ncbi:MAG: lipocalin family protein [Paramuribaculum sp.]|nr:lipocalin family protein [Paramuribaculum sp.]